MFPIRIKNLSRTKIYNKCQYSYKFKSENKTIFEDYRYRFMKGNAVISLKSLYKQNKVPDNQKTNGSNEIYLNYQIKEQYPWKFECSFLGLT